MLSTIVNVTIKGLFTGYKKLLVIILIMAISHPLSAQLLSPSKILLTFSEPMSRETIFDPDNYKVTANDNISVKVIKVGLVEGDSSVVLFINKDDDWYNFTIVVHNLKDKAGNLINAEKKAAEFSTILTKNNPVTVLDVK